MQLTEARARKGLTQWDLRLLTGINQTKLSLIENGYVTPTGQEKAAISSALSIDIDQIEWPVPKWEQTTKT